MQTPFTKTIESRRVLSRSTQMHVVPAELVVQGFEASYAHAQEYLNDYLPENLASYALTLTNDFSSENLRQIVALFYDDLMVSMESFFGGLNDSEEEHKRNFEMLRSLLRAGLLDETQSKDFFDRFHNKILSLLPESVVAILQNETSYLYFGKDLTILKNNKPIGLLDVLRICFETINQFIGFQGDELVTSTKAQANNKSIVKELNAIYNYSQNERRLEDVILENVISEIHRARSIELEGNFDIIVDTYLKKIKQESVLVITAEEKAALFARLQNYGITGSRLNELYSDLQINTAVNKITVLLNLDSYEGNAFTEDIQAEILRIITNLEPHIIQEIFSRMGFKYVQFVEMFTVPALKEILLGYLGYEYPERYDYQIYEYLKSLNEQDRKDFIEENKLRDDFHTKLVGQFRVYQAA